MKNQKIKIKIKSNLTQTDLKVIVLDKTKSLNKKQKNLIKSILDNPDKYFYLNKSKHTLKEKDKIAEDEKILSILHSNVDIFKKALEQNACGDELSSQDLDEIHTFQSMLDFKSHHNNINYIANQIERTINYWSYECTSSAYILKSQKEYKIEEHPSENNNNTACVNDKLGRKYTSINYDDDSSSQDDILQDDTSNTANLLYSDFAS